MKDERLLHRFGEFSLDETARTLAKNRVRIALTPKEFQTLLLLVESAGEAVEKEHLIRTVWPDTYVGDTSLARNISTLRKHLGFETIQTVPKYGYRFSVPVTRIPSRSSLSAPLLGPVQSAEKAADGTQAKGSPFEVGRGRPLRWLVVGVFVVTAGVALVAGIIRPRPVTGPTPPRLAVLPFRNMSSRPAQTDYLRDGLAAELTAHLGLLKYDKLRVLAIGSTREYVNTRKSPLAVAAELDAQYLLDGTVAFEDGQVRVTVELINGPDQAILWSRQFVRPFSEISTVQDEITEAVASSTIVKAPPFRKTAQLHGETISAEAHDAYLEGRYWLEQKTLTSERQALERFQLAVKLDPGYARAYNGISETYIFMAGYILDQKPYKQARKAALAAIHLDEDLGEAHRNLAWVLFNEEADLQGAENEYKRAIEVNPDDARAHHWYSQLLAAQRRSSESVREATTGHQLDPRSLGSRYNYGFMLIEGGQVQAGVTELEKLVGQEPTSDVAWGYLGIGYYRLHRFDQSARAFQRAGSLSGMRFGYQAAMAYSLAMEGQTERARGIVQDLERRYAAGTWVPGEAMSIAYIALADKEGALVWLQRGVEDRSVTLLEANTEPIYTYLSSDPRFYSITAQLRRPQ